MKPTPIYCPQCGSKCGNEYPDRISNLDGGEPGFREGIGENFIESEEWHCSRECADETRRVQIEENHEE